MIKELKYLFYIIIITLILFFTLKFYFSDANKKKSYRSLKNNNKKIINYSQRLILLKNDTDNVIEYVEKYEDTNKKSYKFWKLITNND